jgi:hypothetical protein
VEFVSTSVRNREQSRFVSAKGIRTSLLPEIIRLKRL